MDTQEIKTIEQNLSKLNRTISALDTILRHIAGQESKPLSHILLAKSAHYLLNNFYKEGKDDKVIAKVKEFQNDEAINQYEELRKAAGLD